MKDVVNRFIKDERGSAVVETTLVMPVVLLVIFASIVLFIETAEESKGFLKEERYEQELTNESDKRCTTRLRRWQVYGDVAGK